MVPPIELWNSLKDAPRDGSCFYACFRAFQDPKAPLQITTAQWMCNESGENWGWRAPFRINTAPIVILGWLSTTELLHYQDVTRKAVAPELEFDL